MAAWVPIRTPGQSCCCRLLVKITGPSEALSSYLKKYHREFLAQGMCWTQEGTHNDTPRGGDPLLLLPSNVLALKTKPDGSGSYLVTIQCRKEEPDGAANKGQRSCALPPPSVSGCPTSLEHFQKSAGWLYCHHLLWSFCTCPLKGQGLSASLKFFTQRTNSYKSIRNSRASKMKQGGEEKQILQFHCLIQHPGRLVILNYVFEGQHLLAAGLPWHLPKNQTCCQREHSGLPSPP